MTIIIDDEADPGSYADKFKGAPYYERPCRCYRDRKAKERLKDTNTAIRAKLGMELL